MFGRLKSFFDGGAGIEPVATEAIRIAPDHSMYAVGDIHGCDQQLARLLDKIETEAVGDETLVFLGDLVDRGPHSAQVLSRLYERATAEPQQTIVLMGNHERMMIDFIDDPSDEGARWLRFGGMDTLKSYGIVDVPDVLDAEDALDVAAALEAALPNGMLPWLRDLPLCWTNGNICCVHASMNPEKPVDEQSQRSLLWGHPRFFRQPRTDDLCIVHGHTIVQTAHLSAGRIAVDTGAYRGGPLSAVRVDNDQVSFLTV
ncbi:MAG: metallophosphoesterase family protein [Pseudomonadota bacterium]